METNYSFKAQIEYILNAGTSFECNKRDFLVDHEPAGDLFLKALKADGMVFEKDNKIALTDKGEDVALSIMNERNPRKLFI